jgi:hypothetical protein
MIKVTVRDGIGADLFDVMFSDHFCMVLQQYGVTSEDIIKFKGDSYEYDVIGTRNVMNHKDLSRFMAAAAID